MSFQNIINRATSLEVNSLAMVSSTTTRDGRVKSVSRGAQPWVFTVQLPEGPRWTDYREIIGLAQRYDRHTAQDISFNGSGQEYLFQYQGDLTPPNANGTFNGTWSKGYSQLTITGGTGSGNRLVAGDFIQLTSTGYVYQITQTSTGTSFTLNRPIIDESGSGDIYVGVDCTFSVKCTEFPRPIIFGYNQVGWSGPFIFTEVIE